MRLVSRTSSGRDIQTFRSSMANLFDVRSRNSTVSLYPHGGSGGLNTGLLLLLPLYPYWPETRSRHMQYTGAHTHPDTEYSTLPFFFYLQLNLQSSDWRSETRLNTLKDHSEASKIAHKRHFVWHFSLLTINGASVAFDSSPSSTRLPFHFCLFHKSICLGVWGSWLFLQSAAV